ncbi:hypothetical protein OE88DRAFT_1736836 [Heliocybe sulcata]|uniref:F-box domain-containing protein n=1 Tax=Heliocybe sulcata TaxID=5364 RepID=A0A5C3N1F9_9AGAM|nr:hypothetical protein OE88DRAFT_1736836 [Heliocybe sulcata]
MLSELPPELLDKIFLLASLDATGNTAASLRLVSRYISIIAEPYIFHNVVVHGPRQIATMRNSIQNASSKARSGCRHLFMSDVTEDIIGKLEARIPSPNSGMDMFYDIFCASGMEASDMMLALLQLVAPTLQTFTLLVYDGSTRVYKRVLTPLYPQLVHFHIHIRSLALLRRMNQKILFPSLRSLHVSFALAAELHNLDMAANFATTIEAEHLVSVHFTGLWNNSSGLHCMVESENAHGHSGPTAQSVQWLIIEAIKSPTMLFGSPLHCMISGGGTEEDGRLIALRKTLNHMTYQICRDEWANGMKLWSHNV